MTTNNNKSYSRILIIDNNLLQQNFVSETLEVAGYKVIKAVDGLDGLAQTIRIDPELILLDINLPDIDGYKICALLKKDRKTDRIPVIVMKNIFSSEDREEAFEAGAVDFLTKPIRKNELLSRIEVHLRLNKYQLKLSRKNEKLLQKLSDSKIAQSSLMEQKTVMDTIFENAPIIMILVSMNVQVENINHYGAQSFKTKKKTLLGLLGGELLSCVNASKGDGCGTNIECNSCPVRGSVNKTFETGKNISKVEAEMFIQINEKRTKRTFLLSTILLKTSQSDKVLVCVDDITLQKSADEEIKKSQQRLQDILDSVPGPITMINSNNEYILVNKFFETRVNRSQKEILGKTASHLFSEKVAQKVESGVQEIIKLKKLIYQEDVFINPEGAQEHQLLTRVPLFDNDGEVYAVCNYSTNITVLKQLENELRFAKERADDAVKAKSSFLANMSHEIRTPMNSVLGYLSLLLKDPTLFDAQKKFVETAYKSAHSLLGLINDILDISKLESGKIDIEEIPFNLDNSIHEIIGMMDFQAEEKGITLNWNIKPELSGNYLGDPLRLKQILLNLVGNAIKFTPSGSVSIDIDHPENEQGLYFMVADTGIGISSDRLESIFEPFTQEDSSTSRRYGGTGLGTTIVKQLVELMGGRIWVESELGRGSMFCFSIPLQPTNQIPTTLIDNVKTDLVSKQDTSQSFRRFKILLVEDIDVNIKLALIRLEMNGHRVHIAKNGEEALDAFKKERPDLILMDIHMPGMDGIEATRHIRRMEKDTDSHIPIIAMTASIMKEDTENCKEAGMDDIVGKPIDFDQLFWVMDKTIPASSGEVIYIEEIPELEVVSDRSIPLLNGIDVDKGLSVWKNLELYTNTLINFSGNYRNIVSEIRKNLQSGNFRDICQTAHRLKGVSGNLSITGIFEISSQIEIAGKLNDLTTLDILLKKLEETMDEVVLSISGLNPVEKEIIKINHRIDPDAVSIILKNLFESLSEFNPSACEPYVTQLSEYYPFEKVSDISTSIKNFDFEAARQATKHFAQHLEITLEY